MFVFPSAIGAADQNAPDNGVTIGPNESKSVLVHAASKKKVKKTYKKVKAKKTYKKTYKKSYKKAKAASRYSRSSYKSSGSADTSDATLNSIMRSAAGYRYSSAHHTGAELVRYGSGDCWAFSDYLNSRFQAAGYQSRIVQYATSYSSRHRAVQLYQNGAWKTVPYRAYGYPSLIV